MKRYFYFVWLFIASFILSVTTYAQTVNLPVSSVSQEYLIQDSVLIPIPGGAKISAVVVRKKGMKVPQATALFYTIYVDPARSIAEAKRSADKGYIGVVAHTRGKGISPDVVEPYEDDPKDVYGVIDWISKQSWSNGQVAMYGGSYSGYAAWAATKKMHPALKTIVPYVAAIPGYGLPMENNVFLNANYGWAFYVGNNKYLDTTKYYDRQHWADMQFNWYHSGRPYREIDQVEGTPNPLLQRWLLHPSFDEYWQKKIPYQQDFAQINIPILTITGYYDDGQISALRYFKEHYKYNKNANHYLIIGPYDHFGAQQGGVEVLRDYKVDPVALISTADITYQWMDYVMKGGPKPALIKDKVNYEVMGANEWRHAPSIEKMSTEVLRLYLTKQNGHYALSKVKPGRSAFRSQQVDLADRKTMNNDYYPDPIIRDSLDLSTGQSFISAPFDKAVSVDGLFVGTIKAIINKKDMDIGVVLYEVMPDGKYFHLSYFLGRASYAQDETHRKLLKPGVLESIPFSGTRMVSRQLSKGSRLLVVLDVNKNPFAQVNYGTGKDVSDERISDARIPLQIKWENSSYVDIPIRTIQ